MSKCDCAKCQQTEMLDEAVKAFFKRVRAIEAHSNLPIEGIHGTMKLSEERMAFYSISIPLPGHPEDKIV